MNQKRALHEEPQEPEDSGSPAPRASMVVPRGKELASLEALAAREQPVSTWRAEAQRLADGARGTEFSYRFLSVASAHEPSPELVEAYRCWRTVWADTFGEREGRTTLHSDDFTRQDEIGALFAGPHCVGLTCFRWIDLSFAAHEDDSYFAIWHPEALQDLGALGPRICVVSSLTVLPGWRQAGSRHSVKEMLTALSLLRFLESDADSLAATVRNDRGMNQLMYRFGAIPIVRDVLFHGGPVDLVAFRRGAVNLSLAREETHALVLTLWSGTRESRPS